MSKNSRRNRRDQLHKKLEQARSEVQENPRVNPVQTGTQKGKNVPKTRQQPAELTSVMSGPVEGAKPEAVVSETEACDIFEQETEAIKTRQADIPDWLEGYLKYQSEFTMQLGNQVIEDHQILTDHEWRLHDLEEHVGLSPSPSKTVKPKSEVKKPEPETPEPEVKKPEPEMKASKPEVKKPEPEVKKPAEPEVLPPDKECLIPIVKPEDVKASKSKAKASASDMPLSGAIPREMYEALSFEDGKWRLRGPYKRISKAEQVAKGDLSNVKIVQVWYDPKHDVVLDYLTPEEMDRYCK